MNWRRLRSLFAFALAALPAPAAHAQPVYWPDTGHWYEWIGVSASWPAAKSAAESRVHGGLDGYLATITSPEENAFVLSAFPMDFTWIGLTDEEQEGIYRWVTGQPLAYTNWHPHAPNNSCCGDVDHVRYQSGGPLWNSVQWNNQNSSAFLVEYGDPATDLPPPAATAEIVIENSVLGRRSRPVVGIESMPALAQAREAANLSLSPEGWNLSAVGGFLQIRGDPYFFVNFAVSTGEWTITNVPAAVSDDWGYALNDDAIQHGNSRQLHFHTDANIALEGHNFGEPRGFGVISGLMSGSATQLGVGDWGRFYVSTTPPPPPPSPKIIGVQVGGLTCAGGAHSIGLGSAEQLRPLPWSRINQVSLVLSEQVTLDFDDFVLTDGDGVAVAAFGPLLSPGPEPGTLKATWQLEAPLELGRYQLRLSDTVAATDGRTLDGEWSDGQSTMSGDGQPGGEFVFHFNVLPGDVNGDYAVTALDFAETRDRLGATLGGAAYSLYHDIDRRGSVDRIDFMTAPRNLFTSLPLFTPQPSAGTGALIPEPQSIVLAFVGALIAACYARKRRARCR